MKKEEIKKKIEDRFPCQVGIVKARIFTEIEGNLEKYQKNNHDLQLLENNISKRIDPFAIFPDVKSIIVVIFPYANRNKEIENQRHVTSRSSWGIDYHLVIKDKLTGIKNDLDVIYQAKSMILVDNHPLPERYLAYLAGLGQFGKNQMLINKKYGSYFFISLILTDLTFDQYDHPKLEDICKDCNRCIKACPTEAIKENDLFNAKRCMSYLTQSKDLIPDEFLEKFTKFSFGCDFCQLACVYNNNIKLPILDEFKPTGREIIRVKDLEPLSNRTFKKQYQTLAASFRGKNVLLRNVILVSANQYDKKDLENLEKIEDNGNAYLKQAIDYAKKKHEKE